MSGIVCKVVGLSFLLTCGIALDRCTKLAAAFLLKDHPPVTFLSGFLRFQYTENQCGFLGLGGSLVSSWWTTWLIGAGLLLLLRLAWSQLSQWSANLSLAFAVFLCGGMGNFLDRLLQEGRVVDFVSIGIGSLRTGVFNLADVFLVLGVWMVGREAYGASSSKAERESNTADEPFSTSDTQGEYSRTNQEHA